MSHASRDHRLMDAAHAEALARDGGNCRAGATVVPGHGGALLPSRQRAMDLRSMSRPRVILTKLSVRTSAKGREYLSGFLGKASIVGFKGEPDKYGNPVWDVFACEPEPRPVVPVERPSAEVARGGVDPGFDEMPF
jgi:hypothetical protein